MAMCKPARCKYQSFGGGRCYCRMREGDPIAPETIAEPAEEQEWEEWEMRERVANIRTGVTDFRERKVWMRRVQ